MSFNSLLTWNLAHVTFGLTSKSIQPPWTGEPTALIPYREITCLCTRSVMSVFSHTVQLFCFLFQLAIFYCSKCCTSAPGNVLAALSPETLRCESADTFVRKSSTFLWYSKCESSLKQISQPAVMNITSHIWKVSFTTKINLVTIK
jgi:hypothetical protein